MKHLIRMCWVLASVFLLCLTSCLNEAVDPNSGEDQLPSNVATLSEQVESMKTSINAMESLQTTLSETASLESAASLLESSTVAVKEHIASIEAGLSDVNATLATMRLQKEIAGVTGALKVQVASLENAQTIQTALLSLESGVSAWLGKDFNNFVGVSSELSGLSVLTESVKSQSLTTDALSSDVEAGLRVGDATEELAAMVETVGNNAQTLAKLTSEFETLSAEVEQTYTNAIKSAGSDTKSALKSVNTKAASALKSSAVTLADLSSRISACETEIADIQGRLIQIEASVDELLAKIQSLTFMSEYSEEYAVAYYSMEEATKVSAPGKPYDGKNKRNPVNNIELNYMVRPSAAASAVTKDVVSVVGYYADQIQTKSIDPTRFVNFAVSSVAVTNAERGIVTVTISHDLKDDFYYRQTGAKCALFVATGKTDLSSKFVELYPKDNSSAVYVESIKLNQDDFEIDEGQTKNLTATVSPSSATNKTVTWKSTNTEIATIDQYSGVLTAVKQGNVTITATTNGIDEWGDNLTASVNVKVNPSIRLGGPLYVEVGKNAELSLDFPPAMNVESKVWLSSDKTKATVENGIVTGVAHTYNQYTYQYNPITITCIVNGNITLTHDMSVVVPQPRQIKLNNYGDDVKSVSMKLDQTISLAGSILPANVDASLFRLTYESDGGLGWINFDTGEIKAPGSIGGRYVYIKVKDIDKNTYMKTFVERTVIVNVEPYYVQSISFADVELEPGANVTLVPTFTSDVSGKQPTNTKLTWESSNSQIATVDENGLVKALGVGDVTITATATDGSGVKGTCKVTITVPWKEFEIGDYVVRKSNGEIEFFTSSTDAKNNGTVVGVVIYKGNPRVSDTKLPADCTHGIAISLGEGIGKWWSSSQNAEPYHLTGYVNSSYNTAGYVLPGGVQGSFTNPTLSDLGKKPYGYNNTMLLKEFLTFKNNGTTSDILTKLNEYNADNNKRTPTGASSWYLPSICEMYAVYTANNLLNGSLNTILQGVGGTTLTNNSSWPYWTVSEHADSPSSYAAAINPITGAVYGKFKTTTSTYVRYVFAF